MATSPPSVGNRVRLNPLDYYVNYIAYNTGYIDLGSVEPSLGLPTGYTLTEENSAYYFPVFGIANNYLDSRKFTGNESLVFKNKNLGINNPDPTFNIDISGNFRSLSAYIPVLYTNRLAGTSLDINYSKGVSFNCDVNFNGYTYTSDLTARYITTFYLNTDVIIYNNRIINNYQLNSASVAGNVNITGNLTATDIFVTNSVNANKLVVDTANITSLTATSIKATNDVIVNNNIYATNFYGKIPIDESSALSYNNQNKLTVSTNKNYYFAIRPSDSYSTDDINIARSTTGPSDGPSDSGVFKPYFKNIQSVIDYVYTNGIFGNNLYIYLDEDIIAGENRANDYTYDNSGYYKGCTLTGNASAAFYSTEYIQANLPNLYNAGIKGGDFIWNKNNSADINGEFNYINLYPLRFTNITIQGRFEIGTSIYTPAVKEYSTSRPFTYAPRKVTFRTYICSSSAVNFNNFTGTTASTWTKVFTKSYVQGRQVQFKQSQSTNLTLNNLCFEFDSNSPDSTGLVFYDGNSNVSNTTVALLNNAIYKYGALYAKSDSTRVNIVGSNLLDPFYITTDYDGTKNWNTWSTEYGFSSPNYYPGYGLAIVGNSASERATIINYSELSPYSGFINIDESATVRIIDDGTTSREIGSYSFIQNSLIFDGNFFANCLYNLGDRATLLAQGNIFKTNNFRLSSRYILYNNTSTNASYNIAISDQNSLNFRYINFNGSFSTYKPQNCGFSNWTFYLSQSVNPAAYNTNLNIYNGVYDYYYSFDQNAKTVNMTNALNTIGHINSMGVATNSYNTNSLMYYTDIFGIKNYNELGIFSLSSPTLQANSNYVLNFYTQSIR